MAERVGFEPTEPVKAQQFSRLPDSTTLAPLRERSILKVWVVVFQVGRKEEEVWPRKGAKRAKKKKGIWLFHSFSRVLTLTPCLEEFLHQAAAVFGEDARGYFDSVIEVGAVADAEF